jgi:hypothetical protein
MGVLNPAGALTLAAIAVLVALYLLDRRRRVVRVGALFLWASVPTAVLERRRFRPDPLFLLQLALLLALIAGYLRPYVEGRPLPASAGRLLVVLDVSASMQALERDGSRFELAQRRARALLDELPGGDEAMLVTAAERPHVAQRWTTDRASLRARLEALAPLDTSTNLAPALELALGEARARPETRLAVLTDLAPGDGGIAPDDVQAFHWIQIGATDDNVGIVDLAVDQPPFQPAAAASVDVGVRNFSASARRTTVQAWIGGERWVQRDLTLAPRSTEHALLGAPPHGGILSVGILGDDALAVDDRATGWIGPGAPLDLLLVTDSQDLAGAFGAIAAAVAGSRVEVVARDRYRPESLTGRRVALFDGIAPAALPPAVNALYVAPPAGNSFCPSTRAYEGAAVIDWEPTHPLLRGLESLDAIEVPHATALELAPWADPVVLAASRRAAFPLLVAGERDGRRIACLGTELAAPLTSSDALPLLMLTLGTLRWLAEPFEGGALAVQTGVPVSLGPGPTTPVTGPLGGAGLRIAGDPAVVVADHVGAYRLGPPGGERLILANLFDERESDIGRHGATETAAARVAPASPVPARARREIDWWMYAVGAALLGLEWLTWLRRRDRVSG